MFNVLKTVVIESISDSFFSLDSNIIQSWDNILCVSTQSWPAWLALVIQWFNNPDLFQVLPTVTVITPTRDHHNLFGINRSSSIKWILGDVKSMEIDILTKHVEDCDLCLFDGTLDGLEAVDTAHTFATNPPKMVVALSGGHRLRVISTFTKFQWKQIAHSHVGGVSLILSWIGSTSGFRSSETSAPSPVYVKHAIIDILEYAPPDMHVYHLSESFLKPSVRNKILHPIAHSLTNNIWYSNGIFAPSAFTCTTTPVPQVICPSPFPKSKLGIRNITTKELARIMDLPVAFELRLDNAFGAHVTLDNPIFKTIPSKILLHALWLTEILHVSPSASPVQTTPGNNGRGETTSQSLLISQKAFDSKNVKINQV